jgi:hypothetical protein
MARSKLFPPGNSAQPDVPFPTCINPLGPPHSQLGAINAYESEPSSVYHGATISLRRQMSHGLYFRLGYTYAHAIDDGQDALVAGRPVTVQNSYSPKFRARQQCHRSAQSLVFSWIYEPRVLNGGKG